MSIFLFSMVVLQPKEFLEEELPGGLYGGHAYSITKIMKVGNTPLRSSKEIIRPRKNA